eukprot:7153660-Lingulodinium_polyedra.AAC.1
MIHNTSAEDTETEPDMVRGFLRDDAFVVPDGLRERPMPKGGAGNEAILQVSRQQRVMSI